MPVDKIPVNKMPLDEITVDKMLSDEMALDKLSRCRLWELVLDECMS
jgi:hypothetical protein